MSRKPAPVRTMQQARAFVLKAGICGIFSNDDGRMACLWDVVDLPGRQPGEGGWGQKVTAIWTWKNELPSKYPDEIFYGKIPGGLAVLMTTERLEQHYRENHVPIKDCSALAQTIHDLIRFNPMTTRALRKELDMSRPPGKGKLDKALLELQTTLNIARRASLKDRWDTWVPFREQHFQVVRKAER